MAWRFFQFPSVFTRTGTAGAVLAASQHLNTNIQNSTMAVVASSASGSVAALRDPSRGHVSRSGARAASLASFRRIRDPRAERRRVARCPRSAKRNRRARTDAFGHFLYARRRGRVSRPHRAVAAEFRRGRMREISKSTASAVFPDTPTRPEPVADASAPFPFVSTGQVCVQGHQGRHLPRVRHLPRRWRVPHHRLRLRRRTPSVR